jgi:hypothetical protein
MKHLALVLCLACATPAFADAGTLDAGVAAAVVAPPAPPTSADGGVMLPPGTPETPNLDKGEFVAFLKTAHELAKTGEWGKFIFFIITALVWLARVLGAKFKWKWLVSGWSAIVQAFAWAFAGALATTWGAGDKLEPMDIFQALQYGFSAAGGWAILSFVLEQAGKKWAWAKWLADLVVGKTKPADPVPPPPSIPPVA